MIGTQIVQQGYSLTSQGKIPKEKGYSIGNSSYGITKKENNDACMKMQITLLQTK